MALGPMTTTTALLRILRSDEDAEQWAVFVRRYGPILQGIARRLGLAPEDAADAAQQTLLEFVRDLRAGRFDRSRGRLRSWIASIAEHRCRDIQRVARRREIAIGGELPSEGILGESIADLWEQEEQVHIAALAWQEIRDGPLGATKGCEVFELAVIRGMPADEVARQLGMSVEAVYAARYRVAGRLREVVERISAEFREDAP